MVNERCDDLEVRAQIDQLWLQLDNVVRVLSIGIVLLEDGHFMLDALHVDALQNVGVVVILHDLEDENLVVAQALVVQIDEVPEEVQQFGLVQDVGLLVDLVANCADQHLYLCLIVQHILVVVIHLLQQINATDVFIKVPHHDGQVWNDFGFHLLVVFNQSHDHLITQVQ